MGKKGMARGERRSSATGAAAPPAHVDAPSGAIGVGMAAAEGAPRGVVGPSERSSPLAGWAPGGTPTARVRVRGGAERASRWEGAAAQQVPASPMHAGGQVRTCAKVVGRAG